ncbi:hypothetical protein [Streptomyces sp. TLI_185]|uniref:hypothetical protein n=1 Tax=Streptomyces sp. TLI_185 TaxID=2485151 RepID=UPI000C1AF425|nr:hypothetical protein [Streptomyces sp. TLI_185]RPF33219.1 hypothetical protein EDD92_3125 [Streptomyces sp. TLI_185]
MHSQRGLTRRDLSDGERFLFAVALAVVSLLWITQDMAAWATALCGVGAAAGVSGMLYFGWRHLRK